MTNGEKFKETFPSVQITECESYIQVMGENYEFNNTYPLEWWNAEYKEPTTQERQAESDKFDAAFQDGYDNGYAQARFDYEQEPTTKNDLAHNLCDSCTNIGCEFQSGIVRTECAFYMPPHIDSVKQKLLDSLAEEPTMVISTAYAYAKNYVEYGEDITKAWTTAVQQASILDYVRQKARVEAYDSFKKEYENRLKADMVAMLEELKLEIEELKSYESVDGQDLAMLADIGILFQQKINALKGDPHD